MSGHKLYAPKGVGALYVRKGTRLAPIAFGGHHERDRRPGTENVPGIAAFGAAAELAGATSRARTPSASTALRDRLENAVLDRIPGTGINGSRWNRMPNTSNIYFDGIDGEAMVIALDLRGFAVSTGAACSSGALTPSHVLTAIGLPATAPAPACASRSAAATPSSRSTRWPTPSARRSRTCEGFRCMPETSHRRRDERRRR